MKKALGSLTLTVLALFLGPVNAVAAVKAGDSCKKGGLNDDCQREEVHLRQKRQKARME